jgi:RHS repeat-associated protein
MTTCTCAKCRQNTPQNITGIAVTAYFMGGAYEVTTDANNVTLGTKKYYSIAGMTVAMNDGSGLQYLLTDHLGSVVAVTNASETLTSQQRYLPFGQMRTDLNGPRVTNTDFGYTGQRNLDGLSLMDYHARMYDALLGRFVQPDSIIPSAANPQSWNRFSYVLNDPIGLTDPSGNDPWGCKNQTCITREQNNYNIIVKSHSRGGGGRTSGSGGQPNTICGGGSFSLPCNVPATNPPRENTCTSAHPCLGENPNPIRIKLRHNILR